MLADIECEVLQFFSRDMLDVYQLVSAANNALVAKNTAKLALRNISEVTIGDCRRSDLSCVAVLRDGGGRQEYVERCLKSKFDLDRVSDVFVRLLRNAVIGDVTVKCAFCVPFFRFWAENHATMRAAAMTGWLSLYLTSCGERGQGHTQFVTPLEFALNNLDCTRVRLRHKKLEEEEFAARTVAFLRQRLVGAESLCIEVRHWEYFQPTADFSSCLFESTQLKYVCFSTFDEVSWVHTILQRFLRAGTEQAMPERILVFYPAEDNDPLRLPATVDLPHNVETRIDSPRDPFSEFKRDAVNVYTVRNEERGEFLDVFVGEAKNRRQHGIYFFAIRNK